jgi:hypothetical protein
MSQEPELTEEQARELIQRLIGRDTEVTLYPFEAGWLVTKALTEEQLSKGMHVGQGSYIVDKTGVVTVHPSLPIPMVMAEYSEARREGRLTGGQIWPEPAPPTA